MLASNATDWGFEPSGDDVNWRIRGACAKTGPSGWNPDLWSSSNYDDLGQAVWICTHLCVVRRECKQWASDHPDIIERTVYGGVYWSRGGHHPDRSVIARPAASQPTPRQPAGLMPRRRRDPWLASHMDAIRELIEDGVSYRDIAEIYGTSVSSVRSFVSRHRYGWSKDESSA